MNAVGRTILVLSLLAVACGAPSNSPDIDGTWVGTITTEGDVTTVVNESGSVWGGTATLVEEASIGVEAGSEEYMLGYVSSLYVTEERVVVLDDTADIVRMYTRAGNYLFTVGGRGQGPGEYSIPMMVAMDADGHSYVFDQGGHRVHAYTRAGEYEGSRPVPDFACCAWNYMHPQGLGMLWFPVEGRDTETGETRHGARLYRQDGTAGSITWVPDLEFEPPTFHGLGRELPLPFSGRVVWAPTPDGRVIAGASNRYRFEIVDGDGSRTVVNRYWEPISIDPEELEWRRRRFVAGWGEREGFSWDGSGMLPHRLAFESLMAAVSGEMWVGREVGSKRLPGCTEDPLANSPGEAVTPCYRSVYSLDVFGADGRYLGEVKMPAELWPSGLHIDGSSVTGVTEDESGTIMVKRYRLVLPGEEQ